MPIRLLSSFSSSPLAAVSLASMDTPSVDILGDTSSSFIGALEPFVRRSRSRSKQKGEERKEDAEEGGLKALVLAADDWAEEVGEEVAQWAEEWGVEVEVREGGEEMDSSASEAGEGEGEEDEDEGGARAE